MEPTSVVALITTLIPFATAALKKMLKTDQWGERKTGWNALIPVALGVVSSGVYAYSQGSDPVTALAVGLGSGGAASSARDVDKYPLNLVGGIRALLQKNPSQS
ncbi:MAG: hypothetical protein KCHDKBKB_01035 [Elusimicrobia bacterium]|nr:hypothetical protein [Elusimicrobiota bacterium]